MSSEYKIANIIKSATLIEKSEQKAVVISFSLIFVLMAAYYMLRPVRDAMASDWSNTEISVLWNIQFFLSLTMVAIYGAAVSKINFRYLVPTVYGFFSLSFVSFHFGSALVADQVLLDKGFYLWVSLFSLFHVSVFWSLMADLYNQEQCRRLFGFIAVGASAGAIVGPLVATVVAQTIGSETLMLTASLMMLIPLPIIVYLQYLKRTELHNEQVSTDLSHVKIGGNPLAGFKQFFTSPYLLGIAAFILLYTAISSFAYFEQTNLLRVYDRDQRTEILALLALMRAMGIWRQFQAARVGQDRLAKLYDLKPEAGEDAGEPAELNGHIEVRDVCFSYDQDEDEKRIFDGISFEARPGETIGIRGGNGVGKSTLLWLLTGALRPDSGQVLFDGRDAADWSPQALRRQIAYVPQKGVLFEGTLMDNLTMFRSEEKGDEAAEMAERLGLDTVIAQLPRGFETRVGDSAVESLPGGVRQQIAIVRSLLDDKRIILFDEANTALDRRADARLQDTLKAEHGRRTMILVSYRPSVLKLADRIYELKNGRLVEAAGDNSLARPEDVPESKAVELRRALRPRARVAAANAAKSNQSDSINESTSVPKTRGGAGSG